ncbi:restriction endonuclease [Methanohalobium evestigatum Z-7303]|uniref:Restriction endonuclease n=1 Tax=Methanohalobium evestigatum (strain ATCC BAA-1072 / DSM 3721 / NBRC 107634 / OCM 161 / Z-7303) TaxID=644295 RepID=D7E7L4_METEZ|nr:restriction endonuclease [Methanohalobium evestigatum]ADI74087.1 restriction endonuclease [Methanohalobium evestigatum Z-7303]
MEQVENKEKLKDITVKPLIESMLSTDDHSTKKDIEGCLVGLEHLAADTIIEHLYHDGYNQDLENILIQIGQPAVDCLSEKINCYHNKSGDIQQMQLILDRIEDCIENPDSSDSKNQNQKVQSSASSGNSTQNNNLDKMSWKELEELLVSMYRDKGYLVESVGTKDMGADFVITEYGVERTAVLIKHLNQGQKVTRNAVQEVAAAKDYYQCNGAMVISNQEFTQKALILAESNDVSLIGREQLEDMVNQ